MAGHAQLKFVMTECSKTQIRLTGLKYKTAQAESQEDSSFPIDYHQAIFNKMNKK